MAIGTGANFIIFDAQMQAGFTEVLQQRGDAFNAASRGAIVMRQNLTTGDYARETFFKSIAGLITRRNLASLAAVTPLSLDHEETILVKINRKIGPVAMTMNSWRKIGEDPGELSVLVGQQAAVGVSLDMLNTGIRAAVAALSGEPSLVLNVTAASPTDTISTDNLIQTLYKAGDSAGGIRLWAMHSTAYSKLMRNQVTTHAFDAGAGVVINEGTAVTLGIPTLVTDSPSLHANTSPTDPVKVLGLREGAIRLEESEIQDMVVQPKTGFEQLYVEMQGEYAFNVGVLGFKYLVEGSPTGGPNPTDATLGASASWDRSVTDVKSAAGVMMIADPA